MAHRVLQQVSGQKQHDHKHNERDQEAYLEILAGSARGDRDPLCRLAAIKSLGRWKDPRAAMTLKDVTEQIRRLNQASMESASREARAAASSAQRWSLLGLLAATAATGLLTWHAGRTILRPVEELTRSVRAIGEGRLSRQLQVTSHDELGLLVESFNRMTAQLRDLRQSESAKLLRTRQASQATIDAFPDAVVVVDPEGHVEMANPAAGRMLGHGAA